MDLTLLLSYQVRFGLLQAASYGAPQKRVRLIIVIAAKGEALPQLPTSTHNCPVSDSLIIRLPDEPLSTALRPVSTAQGTAPNHYITIRDAIGDLPRYHW